jgi:hypothetical protein
MLHCHGNQPLIGSSRKWFKNDMIQIYFGRSNLGMSIALSSASSNHNGELLLISKVMIS